jgi:hypothetical protein
MSKGEQVGCTETPERLAADIIDRQNGFVRIEYLIDQGCGGLDQGASMKVEGFAFETPGWPEFHACVRRGRRWNWYEEEWIVDHYESGYYVSVGKLANKEDAPMALAAKLKEKGREKVHAVLRSWGAL